MKSRWIWPGGHPGQAFRILEDEDEMRNALKAGVAGVAVLLLGYLLAGHREPGVSNFSNAGERQPLALSLPALNGGRWSLAEERGKIVVVNFWATWCPPCRMETPGLVSIANRYAAKGVQVVGVSMDDEPQRAVPAFVSRFGIPYPILLPTADSPLASSIESLPTSLLIDRNGRVVRTYLGAVDERTLAKDIDQLLSEHNGGPAHQAARAEPARLAGAAQWAALLLPETL